MLHYTYKQPAILSMPDTNSCPLILHSFLPPYTALIPAPLYGTHSFSLILHSLLPPYTALIPAPLYGIHSCPLYTDELCIWLIQHNDQYLLVLQILDNSGRYWDISIYQYLYQYCRYWKILVKYWYYQYCSTSIAAGCFILSDFP